MNKMEVIIPAGTVLIAESGGRFTTRVDCPAVLNVTAAMALIAEEEAVGEMAGRPYLGGPEMLP